RDTVPDEFDPFAGGTGRKSGRAVVVDAFFQFPEGGGNLNLVLVKDFGDNEPPNEDRYGCGGDWITPDGAQTTEHPTGARTLFNSQTAYHQLLARALKSGAEDVLGDRWQKV